MAFYTSISGLSGAQTELSTLANNIANVGTNGFKRSRVSFGDVISGSPLQNPSRVIGSGTAVRSVSQQFQQGPIETSDSALDMAVSGQGFFTVKGGPGESVTSFTRNGAFARRCRSLCRRCLGPQAAAVPHHHRWQHPDHRYRVAGIGAPAAHLGRATGHQRHRACGQPAGRCHHHSRQADLHARQPLCLQPRGPGDLQRLDLGDGLRLPRQSAPGQHLLCEDFGPHHPRSHPPMDGACRRRWHRTGGRRRLRHSDGL